MDHLVNEEDIAHVGAWTYGELEEKSSTELVTKTKPDAAPTSLRREVIEYVINWLIQSKPHYLEVQFFLVIISDGGLINRFPRPIDYILDRLTQSIPQCLSTREDSTEVWSLRETIPRGGLMSQRRQSFDYGGLIMQSTPQTLATRNPSTLDFADTMSEIRTMGPLYHDILYQVLRDRPKTGSTDRPHWQHESTNTWIHGTLRRNSSTVIDSRFSKDALEVSPFSPVLKRYFVNGTVKGKKVAALPDNGAGLCFISKSMVKQLHLRSVPGTQRSVRLANKKLVHSPGMVEVPWEFAGEKKKHLLKCWVLQESSHDLVLGSSFLRATQTLTKYIQRIKSKVIAVPRILRLQLLGNENQRLWGYLNGQCVAAFPDTGSDAMLISKEYAEKHELDINTNIKALVELGDGTTAWTSGIVRDMSWEVGGMAVQCDFHVLDDLCVDVVLSNNYLFEFKIFQDYTEYLEDGIEGGLSQLCNIRLIGQYSQSLDLLEEEYLKDVKSPDAFAPEKVQRELARRDYIRDAIAALPVEQQDAARLSEIERQRRWESLKKAHQASKPQLPTSQPQQDPSPSLGTPTVMKLIKNRNNVQARVALRTWWKKKTGVLTTSPPLQSHNRAS